LRHIQRKLTAKNMRRIAAATFVIIIFSSIPMFAASADVSARCHDISKMDLPNVTITTAEPIDSGTFTDPILKKPISNLPPFCRVAATLKPTPDSNIKIELWMPEENWNGRFLGTGNGGGAGQIKYSALELGLRRGFATANTDMGTSPAADLVTGHPERYADFGYRSTHVMTTVSKTLLADFYRKPQSRSYFVGCSTGGEQALMEAQRFPGDYNGIVAGAPANNRTHLHTGFLWNLKATNSSPGEQLSWATIAWINHSVIMACAGKDGGSPEDDFLTDPRECKFSPATLPKCSGVNTAHCLTDAQLTALKQIYAGPTNRQTGERIYTPIPVGSELSRWGLLEQENPVRMYPSLATYPFEWAFGAKFNYLKFDYDRDMDVVDGKLARVLNANNPDLSQLQKRGGKLLMFTGTADPLVPYQDALNYYDRVLENQQKTLAKSHNSDEQQALVETQDFFRYFLVPGMDHCNSGPGLHDFGQELKLNVPLDSSHDLLTALVGWVEEGKSPDSILATTYLDDKPEKGIEMQRPICPYPEFPDYIGGDWKSASSYRCTAHPMGMVLAPAKRYLN